MTVAVVGAALCANTATGVKTDATTRTFKAVLLMISLPLLFFPLPGRWLARVAGETMAENPDAPSILTMTGLDPVIHLSELAMEKARAPQFLPLLGRARRRDMDGTTLGLGRNGPRLFAIFLTREIMHRDAGRARPECIQNDNQNPHAYAALRQIGNSFVRADFEPERIPACEKFVSHAAHSSGLTSNGTIYPSLVTLKSTQDSLIQEFI